VLQDRHKRTHRAAETVAISFHQHAETSHGFRRKKPRSHHPNRLPIDAKVTLAAAPTKRTKRRKRHVVCRKYVNKHHLVSNACSRTHLNRTSPRRRRPRWRLATASEEHVVSTCYESSCSCFTCWHLLFWFCEHCRSAGRKLQADAGRGSRLGSSSEVLGDGGEVSLCCTRHF